MTYLPLLCRLASSCSFVKVDYHIRDSVVLYPQMCSKALSLRFLLGVYLLVIYICVIHLEAAPVPVANQPRTGAEDEGALMNDVHNRVGDENHLLHSDHPPLHGNSDPRAKAESAFNSPDAARMKSALLHDEAERPTTAGQVIKNFSPVALDERLAVSRSTSDRQNARNQQELDLHSRQPSSSEERAPAIPTDGLKDAKKEALEQPKDLQGRINSKLNVLTKNADKSKRLSFFSVLHPALAAALSPEKHQNIADIPRPPLDNVEYTSGPLRGTESHDHDALHYPAAEHSKQSVLAELQETAASRTSETGERKGYEFDAREGPKQKENGDEFAAHDEPSTNFLKGEELHRSVEQPQLEEAATAQESYGRTPEQEARVADDEVKRGGTLAEREMRQRSNQPDLDESRVEPESSEPEKQPHQTSVEKQASVLNATSPEEPSRAQSVIRTTVKYWHGFVNNVRKMVEALRNPKYANQASKNLQKDKFTEDDVQEMVNGVVREIQMRTEGKDLSKSGGDSTATKGEHEKKMEGKGPLLMLRTKTVVSSDVVADAVTTAAKKMLTERGDALSHDTSSKLLRVVQDKLEELLQPID